MKVDVSAWMLLGALASPNAFAFVPHKDPKVVFRVRAPLFMESLAEEWAARNRDVESTSSSSAVPIPSPVIPKSPSTLPVNSMSMAALAQEWAARNRDADAHPKGPQMPSAFANAVEANMPPPEVHPSESTPENSPSSAVVDATLPFSLPAAPPANVSQIVPVSSIPTPTSSIVGQGSSSERLDQIAAVLASMNRHMQEQSFSSAAHTNHLETQTDRLEQIADVLSSIGQTVQQASIKGDVQYIDNRVDSLGQQLQGIQRSMSEQTQAIQQHTESIQAQTEALEKHTRHQRILSAMSLAARKETFDYHYPTKTGATAFQSSQVLLEDILSHFLEGRGYCLPHEAVIKNPENRRFLPNSKENWLERWENDYEEALAKANLEFRSMVVQQLTAILGQELAQAEENGWFCLYFSDNKE